MIVGVLGDIHGDFSTVSDIMKANSNIKYWLCTGDVADKNLDYFSPPLQLYWINGNHEDFEKINQIDRGLLKIPNLFHIPNAKAIKINGISILGLGGNYSPKYYDVERKNLPKGRERHYTKNEVEKCTHIHNIDILITHEAPSPHLKFGKDVGRKEITRIIEKTNPKFHIFCHHHNFGVHEIIKGIKSICLDYPRKSWIKLNSETYEF